MQSGFYIIAAKSFFDSEGKQAYSEFFNDKDNKKVPLIAYAKAIDGVYYIVEAVPDVLERGKQIDYQPNWKGRGYDSYVFAGQIDYEGKPAYVAAVVTKGDDNRFYLHEVLDENSNIIFTKKETGLIKTGVTAQGGVTGEPASNDIIAQNNQNMQEDIITSTIADNNSAKDINAPSKPIADTNVGAKTNKTVVEKTAVDTAGYGNAKVIGKRGNIDILDSVPDGWKRFDMMTAPVGYVGVTNNKSLFGGERKSALVAEDVFRDNSQNIEKTSENSYNVNKEGDNNGEKELPRNDNRRTGTVRQESVRETERQGTTGKNNSVAQGWDERRFRNITDKYEDRARYERITSSPEFYAKYNNGKPILLFHGTNADFDAFRPGPTDIGIHFGNISQAKEMLERKKATGL